MGLTWQAPETAPAGADVADSCDADSRGPVRSQSAPARLAQRRRRVTDGGIAPTVYPRCEFQVDQNWVKSEAVI